MVIDGSYAADTWTLRKETKTDYKRSIRNVPSKF